MNGSLSTRAPAVAGTFYPGERSALAAAVDGYLRDASRPEAGGVSPKALVAPHAGYVYSGGVAASAYATWRDEADRIERVVLLGPSHRVAVRGLATTAAARFATPLGNVEIDVEACARAARLPQVCVDEEAHAFEHSLEVHLPFLQRVLDAFRLVPFAVGSASADEVAEVLDQLWGGDETRIVVSTDLSHYHDYESARRLDAATCRAIESLDPAGLDAESACGRVPVRGLLACATRRGLAVETLDLRSSGDTAGPRDRVVGYGAWAFREPLEAGQIEKEEEVWDPAWSPLLLATAHEAIAAGEAAGGAPPLHLESFPFALREPRATFVTLRREGRLRGCIGSLEATRPLAADVAESAWRAAYRDPRFPPLGADERDDLEVHVSVLSPLERIHPRSEAELLRMLRPGVDGLVIEHEGAHATFLPEVWEQLPEPARFLAALKDKAGFPAESDPARWVCDRYTTRGLGD